MLSEAAVYRLRVPVDTFDEVDGSPRAKASAKHPDTLARRIEQFVAMLARGETVYPQKRKLGD